MKLTRIASLAVLLLFASRAVWCQARSKDSLPTAVSAKPSKPRRVREVLAVSEPDRLHFSQTDRGVFPELNAQIHIRHPEWLEGAPAVAIRVVSQERCYLYVDGVAVAQCRTEDAPLFEVDTLSDPDPDHDGIPSSLDILIGAKKTVLLKSPYRETYRRLSFPNGDLPRDEGVCSDVIVRALRNAGYDLQALVQADRALAPGAYPGIIKPDANIDHRRVRNLLVYFTRNFQQLPVDSGGSTNAYLPGDILLFDTMSDPRPEHIGIVSDSLGPSGHPLIVNSWTNGYETSEMDLLSSVPVTHRFRAPSRVEVPKEQQGLAGLLRRQGIALGPEHRQLVVTLAPTWASSYATLYTFERTAEGTYRRAAEPVVARLGSLGLARGRGLDPHATASWSMLPEKIEGDHRSPAGLFSFGTAFGKRPMDALSKAHWPYRRTSAHDFWVDDASAPEYNTWQTLTRLDAPHAWSSSERLDMYELAVVIRHNEGPVVRGKGSAIFLHDSDLGRPTTGCTGIKRADLLRLVHWLEPKSQPVIVQTAGSLFE